MCVCVWGGRVLVVIPLWCGNHASHIDDCQPLSQGQTSVPLWLPWGPRGVEGLGPCFQVSCPVRNTYSIPLALPAQLCWQA